MLSTGYRKEDGMRIELGISEKELEAITWMETFSNIVNETVSGQPEALNAMEDICFLLDRIYEVAWNECMINEDKIREQEIEDGKLPVRQRILSDEEKKDLKNEEIFRKEYGLYTNFAVNQYWSSVFKEIYGYSPSLPL